MAIRYTEEMLTFLRQHEETPRAELACKFNEKFGCNISVDSVKAKCLRMGLKTGRTGCFSPGHKTWNSGLKGLTGANSTSFKKGNTPLNHRPVGYERITVDGYVEVKVSEPNVFELKHRWIWEQHHGKILDNHVLVFKNMNKQDCRPENLMLISRAKLARLNQSFSKLATPDTNETCILMAKIKDKTHKLKVA